MGDSEQFALLMVDFQKDFLSPTIQEAFPELADRVSELAAQCRSSGIEVIHVRAKFAPDGSDWMPRYRLVGWIPCVSGTAGAEVLEFAREVPGESVFEKQTFDALLVPELIRHLEARGRKFLLIAGLVTATCVLLTASSAMQRGFLVSVVEDAVADHPNSHTWILERYRFIFESVKVSEILDRIPKWTQQLSSLGEDPQHT